MCQVVYSFAAVVMADFRVEVMNLDVVGMFMVGRRHR
jgi:hypothetical protein